MNTAALSHTISRIPPYLGLGVFFPRARVAIRSLPRALQDAYDIHRELYARPGFSDMMQRLEREDLLTLPAMAVSTPLDLTRIRRKFRDGAVRLPVTPSDSFPYPDYYLNDFHNQKNGNLSLQAALTYEWQISILFLNCNRLMRQGVIDEIPEGRDLDILDVACGTAAWIPQARLQGRQHPVTGIDLSPAYLKVARLAQRIGMRDNAKFLQMNAESLSSEWTNRFDVVTSIWLLHELPRAAQERVLDEMVRVLKPGGRLLLMDSMQDVDISADRKEAAEAVHRFFARFFNEPYYLAYQHLDVAKLLAARGLIVEKRAVWFRSTLWVATKPQAS